jgi:hypothetical protein
MLDHELDAREPSPDRRLTVRPIVTTKRLIGLRLLRVNKPQINRLVWVAGWVAPCDG